MKIWVTRAEPGAGRTAERLRAMGHEPLVAPVLAVHPLAPAIDLSDIGALAFTSGNGVRAFSGLSPARGLPVFTVGEATAQAARAAGFGVVVSAGGDVAALATMIAGFRESLAGTVLFAGAAEPAGDLIGALTAGGVKARAVAVYETLPVAVEVPPDAQAVLIHSAKAAAQLAAVPLAGLTVYAISAAAAAPLSLPAAIAAKPNEASLLALLPPR